MIVLDTSILSLAFRRRLRDEDGFHILLASEAHHVRAAQIRNACRHHGLACSTIDALIAAQAIESGGRLFTTDADFQRIALHCPLELVDEGAGRARN